MEAIVAVYTDWGIGSEGTQPIVVPEDRRRFAEITKGATLIVGSKTLLDFPESQPLKGRRNLIMTRQDTAVDGAEIVHTPEEALELCGDDEQVFVVDGPLFGQNIRHEDRRHPRLGRLLPQPRLPARLGADEQREVQLRRPELRVLRV